MKLAAAISTAAVLSACIPSVAPPYAAAPPAQRYPDEPPPEQPYPDRDWRPQRGDDDRVAALPAPRPAWEARLVVADAQEVRDQTYVVRPGDTLSRVSNTTGAGADAIARATSAFGI